MSPCVTYHTYIGDKIIRYQRKTDLPERVMIMIVRGFKLDVHQEDRGEGRDDENDFHECVVRRYECGEQV